MPSAFWIIGAFGCRSQRLVTQVLALLLATFVAGATVASGASGHPEAEVLPNSVELLPGGQRTRVLVVLRNATEASLRDVGLSWLNDEAVKISAASSLHLASLAPHAETAWTLEFSQAGLDPVTGSVRLRIDYKEESVPKIVALSVPVKSREPALMDSYLDAKIETTLETLDTYHRGKVNLLLTNKLGRKLLLNIQASGPDFICFPADQKDCGSGAVAESVGLMRRLAAVFRRGASAGEKTPSQTERRGIEIEPYQTRVEVFEVGAKERVEPGKYLLAFEIFLTPSGTQSVTRSVVKTQVVEVGVLEDCIREDLNKRAPRMMAVLRPLKLIIDNYPENQVEEFETVNNPEDVTMGSRTIPFSKILYIEQDDFRE
ncbi:MAG: hypothetical protein LAN64_08550, partial [Acidobacteriia bacterium]|nr:hypothetical protein [Terriglobia bacterium]